MGLSFDGGMVFPDPRTASPEGVVAVGVPMSLGTLLEAYRSGIFPWPIEGCPLLWFSPPERGLLRFSDLNVPRTLQQVRRNSGWRCTIDQAFADVMRGCADSPRPGQPGTWITDPMLKAYAELHRKGHAHSVETWAGETLIGGIYGVDAGGAFSAESMFYREPNASKVALLHLVDRLQSRGLDWLDIETMSPHMERLGARPVERELFLSMLAEALERGRRLFD